VQHYRNTGQNSIAESTITVGIIIRRSAVRVRPPLPSSGLVKSTNFVVFLQQTKTAENGGTTAGTTFAVLALAVRPCRNIYAALGWAALERNAERSRLAPLQEMLATSRRLRREHNPRLCGARGVPTGLRALTLTAAHWVAADSFKTRTCGTSCHHACSPQRSRRTRYGWGVLSRGALRCVERCCPSTAQARRSETFK
jgi:hypothetical protein